jgi:sulfoacetaldehyde dehydrogenase
VGAGNVAVIVDEYADPRAAAERIARSKVFDHATSCSSENGVVVIEQAADALLAALIGQGGVLLSDDDQRRLQALMFPDGHLSSAATAQAAPVIARLAGLSTPGVEQARFLMVRDTGAGPQHPFSGEKLAPVLTVWRAPDFAAAVNLVDAVYAYQGAGHSVGLHTQESGPIMEERAHHLATGLPVCRVIVNQAHAMATGGSFDNGLPFSLSMGCGSWGRNSFSDNLNYRHYMNITRIARRIPERTPAVEDLLADYFREFGA